MKQNYLKEIEKQIKEIDQEIHALHVKKKKLLDTIDKIKIEIQEEKSAALANEDWEKG